MIRGKSIAKVLVYSRIVFVTRGHVVAAPKRPGDHAALIEGPQCRQEELMCRNTGRNWYLFGL